MTDFSHYFSEQVFQLYGKPLASFDSTERTIVKLMAHVIDVTDSELLTFDGKWKILSYDEVVSRQFYDRYRFTGFVRIDHPMQQKNIELSVPTFSLRHPMLDDMFDIGVIP